MDSVIEDEPAGETKRDRKTSFLSVPSVESRGGEYLRHRTNSNISQDGYNRQRRPSIMQMLKQERNLDYNSELMKKIPEGSELASVLVGMLISSSST